jgi:NRPS condensation-like uncharacterized protein
MVPVDLRRYLPDEKQRTISNFSSAVYPSITPQTDETFPEILRRVNSVMDVFKEEAPGLGNALLMTIGAMNGGRMLRDRYKAEASRGSRFINLTNFGPIDDKSCDFGELQPFQVYGIGPIQYAPGILLAISTYRKRMHFVVQGNDFLKFKLFIRSFVETVIHTLKTETME